MLAEFQMYPARALASSWADVVEEPGCYIMVLLDHENDVNAALLAHAAEVPVFAAWPLLYVGATGDNLRTRLKSHLGLETRNSSLRQSAGLLLKDTLGLRIHPIPGKRYFCFKDEAILTNWLLDNTLVGVCPCDDPFLVEDQFLAAQPGLFNISGCAPTPITHRLRALRDHASSRRPR